MIQQDFGGLAKPRIEIARLPDLAQAIEFLSTTKEAKIDLAIIEIDVANNGAGRHFGKLLEERCPGCPVIIVNPSEMPPQEMVAGGSMELIDEPVDAAELIAAAAALLDASPFGSRRPDDCKALRARARRMLKQQLARLRSERLRVEREIQELTNRIATEANVSPTQANGSSAAEATSLPDGRRQVQAR